MCNMWFTDSKVWQTTWETAKKNINKLKCFFFHIGSLCLNIRINTSRAMKTRSVCCFHGNKQPVSSRRYLAQKTSREGQRCSGIPPQLCQDVCSDAPGKCLSALQLRDSQQQRLEWMTRDLLTSAVRSPDAAPLSWAWLSNTSGQLWEG